MHIFYSFSTQTSTPRPPTPKRTHPILKLIDERFKNKFVRGWVEEGFD
jgi:hypothetical protein